MNIAFRVWSALHLIVLIVGCGPIKHEPENVVLVPKKDTVNIPAYLLEKCAPINKIPVRKYNQGETITILQGIVTQSEVCRSKDDLLVEAIKKAFNVEQQKQPSK